MSCEKRLLKLITTAQKSYIEKFSVEDIFEKLLDGILQLTNSEYGFIGEVLYDKDKLPYLKTMAITNIAWNDELKQKFKYDKTGGIVFKNLNTLFGLVMINEELIISNNPTIDKRRGGKLKCPVGHPPLTRFCGIPFFINTEFIGMVGIANCPQDYNSNITQKYEPFFNTCSLLINAVRQEIIKKESERNNMDFISQISHELKTPLNSILGFSQLLKQETDSEYVDYIINGGELLMNLINNSLNLNRLDTYSINNTYILLNKSINDSIQNHIVSINKLGLSIINKIPDNIFIYCDKFLYDRILKNLISNAIKFNEPSGIIEFIHKIINKKIHLTIKNTGQLKISRELLFKPFETSDKYGGGTGLGLSIIHKICKLIDEKIIYDNNEEGFVKFTFTLDYKESITKKIVYIEDNKMNQILMSKILKEYDIDMKNNANNLLSYINNYDILLLDLNLDNNISGLNVIEILKKNNITIPIIVITADTNNKTLEKLHKLGIKFFNKPIMVNTFKLYIKKHFLD
jgi:CheY-like chemotaxis protein